MSRDPQTTHFKRSAIPVALVAGIVVATQLGYEFSLPADGPERAAALESGHAWTVRIVGAVVLSLMTPLLAWGLYRDRGLVRSRDDRLAGEYIAAALLSVLFCTFCGAFPGMVVSTLVLAAIPVLRWKSADVRGPAARDARNITFLAMAANLMVLGTWQSYRTYLQWQDGYGLSEDRFLAFEAEHGGHIVVGAAMVVAILVVLLLPLSLWRNRRRLAEALSANIWAGFGVAAVSLIARNWAGVVVGILCMPAAVLLAKAHRAERSPMPD